MPSPAAWLLGKIGSLVALFGVLGTSVDVVARPLNWVQTPAASPGPQWSTTATSGGPQRPLSWRTVDPSDQVAGSEPEGSPGLPEAGTAAKPPGAGPVVMAMSRGITVNRTFYPDVALTVPSGFKRDPQRFLSLALDGTNQVRRPTSRGCRGDSTCADAEFNAELALLQAGPASLELLYNVADPFPDSNSSRTWTGQSLGFRLAVNVSPTVGIAIGGESLLDLDNKSFPVDGTGAANLKGRTYYAVASAAIPMSKAEKPPVLTLSAGAGSGYYGFDGSGASDSQWGPFGSISYAFNEYVAVGVEYSGYAFSGGISLKPFKDVPLTGSLYITDFLGNFPSHIENYCYKGDCDPRVLGRLTYSF